MPETPSSVGATVKKNKTMFMVLGAGALGVLAYAWWKAGTRGQPGATATDFQGTPQDQFIPPYQQYQTSGAVDLSQLPPIDNPAWSQRVQSILVDIGFDPGLVADSVGKFLNRQPLNGTEADLIRSAIAYVGPPPLGQFSIIPVAPTAAVSLPKAPTFATQLHRVSRVWNLRAYAKRFAPDPNNPTSVEAELRRIVAANPTLAGRTTIPSGYAVKTPVIVR